MLRIGDAATAEVLTNDIFVRLLSALWEPSAPQNTVKGWLFGVASRVVIDYYHKNKRVTGIALAETLIAHEDSPETRVIKQMRVATLYLAIQTLTKEQQRVIALRFGAELGIRKITQIVGKIEGAIKQLQMQAVTTMTRVFAPEVVYDAR